MPNRHRCRHPLWHGILIGAVMVLWTALFALSLIPKAVYRVTHSGAWAWISVGLALTVGLVIVKGLVAWRCQWPYEGGRAWPWLRLAHLSWILRGEP